MVRLPLFNMWQNSSLLHSSFYLVLLVKFY